MISRIMVFLLLLFISGCASQQMGYKGQKSIEQIAIHGFQVQKIHTSSFILYALLRPSTSHTNQEENLHVYIEGDGLAWLTRTQPSSNPTPTDEVTRQLAYNDKSNSPILYLARPCQYVVGEDRKFCEQKYWTSHRFAEEVIVSMNEAVEQIKKQTQAKNVSLIGYSGGGAVAALIASRRSDVTFLGSVAGLLDHATWTRVQKITPLRASLNPLDVAHKVSHIPQVHLSGSKDEIIRLYMNEKFCQEINKNQLNPCKEVNGMAHNSAWFREWDYNAY